MTPAHPMILVEWLDASWSSSPYTLKEAQDYTLVRLFSVGHLIAENESRIIIATDHQDLQTEPLQDTWRHLVAIPKVGIVKRTVLVPETPQS